MLGTDTQYKPQFRIHTHDSTRFISVVQLGQHWGKVGKHLKGDTVTVIGGKTYFFASDVNRAFAAYNRRFPAASEDPFEGEGW